MDEIENLINMKNIDIEYHKKIFGDGTFEKLYTKVNLQKFEKLKNSIYWMSLVIYKIAFNNYLKNINERIGNNKKDIMLNKNSLIVYHPIVNISSEICKYLQEDYVYPSIISLFGRQIIEQICIIKEFEEQQIDEKTIVEAMIESYNRQIACDSLNFEDLNMQNKGLLKVLNNKTTYGKLASKYCYGYLYNLFSGDIHTLSQIDKLLPFGAQNENKYYEIYLKCILSLLKDLLDVLNKYNYEKKIDLNSINKIDFIDIKSNKKTANNKN